MSRTYAVDVTLGAQIGARHRWGRTKGKIGYQGGKVEIVRPRVRVNDGEEMLLPSWRAAAAEDWLGKTP